MPATRPAAVGCDKAGRAQPIPPGASWLAWLPLSGRPPGRGAHTKARDRRPHAQADLHIEFELSGPMPHFSGAMV